MNLLNKIFLTFVYFLISGTTVFGQNCKAVLNIITDIDSSRIYVNGNLAGIGKTEIELETGIYVVKAVEPPPVWNAQIIQDTVRLTDCSRPKIVHLLFSSLRYLNSNPQNASVYAGDSLIGYTPLFINSGMANAEIMKEGYAAEKISLKTLPFDKTVDLRFTGEPEGRNFFKRNIFKYLVGGIVVLGGVTAYFKIKADNRYSEYQAGGSQVKLDETRKFDLISGIAMGGLEINFGLLMYYFLTD